MLPRNHPDRIQITFDDRRLVANAGLLLPATLARHLGLPELVQQRLDLGDAPGRANTGDKMMTLVASALAGGDCIDDADVLRTGGTACTLGGTVKAPLRAASGGAPSTTDRELLPASLGPDRTAVQSTSHSETASTISGRPGPGPLGPEGGRTPPRLR